MSKIVDEALAIIQDSVPNVDEITVTKVCIGWGFTGVKLSTGHVGICHSLLNEQTVNRCRIVRYAGKLTGCSGIELANFAKSSELSESVVGTATLSSLSQIFLDVKKEKYAINEGNFSAYIEEKIKRTDTVALIGRIKPLINLLQRKAKRLYIFERNPRLLDGVTLPVNACEDILPKADVVVITGSSVANKTIEHVLKMLKKAREVGVVGPSASIVPDPLFNRGVTILSCIKPIDAERLLQIIAEGGGTQQIKPAVQFINIQAKSLS